MVELLTVKLAAAAPNFTAVEPVKLVPVIVTGVAVVLGPELGLTPVTVGAEAPCRCTGRPRSWRSCRLGW